MAFLQFMGGAAKRGLQKIEDKSLEVRIELPWADDNLYVYHTFEHNTGENGYEDKGEVVLYTETEVDHG